MYVLGWKTSLSLPLRSKKDANVSWNALMIQEVSPSVMSRSFCMCGNAAKSALKLKASRNCTKQNMTSKAYFFLCETG